MLTLYYTLRRVTPTLPYHTLPHHNLSYPTLPYPTLPYPAPPRPAPPRPALPCPALPCPALPYPSLPYPTLPYPTLPCPTLPYCTKPLPKSYCRCCFKAIDRLQSILPEYWRSSQRRKKLRAVSCEELPWRAQVLFSPSII